MLVMKKYKKREPDIVEAILGAIGAIVTIHVQAYTQFKLYDFALFISLVDCCLGLLLICSAQIWRDR